MNFLARALRRFLEGQILPAIADDSIEAERHIRFLSILLSISALGVGASPLLLAAGIQGSAVPAIAVAWLIVPLAIAAYVIRTGGIDRGRLAAVCGYALFVSWLCLVTGGSESPALILLAGAPLIGSGDRSRTYFGVVAALLALLAIAVVGTFGAFASDAGWQDLPNLAVAALVIGAVALWGDRRFAASVPDVPAADMVVEERIRPRHPVPASEQAMPDGTREDMREALDAIIALSGRLAADASAANGDGDLKGLAGLIRVSGEQVKRGLGLHAGEADDGTGDPRIRLREIMDDCVARKRDRLQDQLVSLETIVEDGSLDAGDAVAIRALIAMTLEAAIRSARRGDGLRANCCWRDDAFRMSIAGVATEWTQPFLQHDSRYSPLRITDADLSNLMASAASFGGRVTRSGGAGSEAYIEVTWTRPLSGTGPVGSEESEVRRSA